MILSIAMILLVGMSLGLACGDAILSTAVLAIVLTVPLGAFAIDLTYRRALHKNVDNSN